MPEATAIALAHPVQVGCALPALTMQPACTSLPALSRAEGSVPSIASVPQSAIANLQSAISLSPGSTPAEEREAREKFAFCAEVRRLAREQSLPLKSAALVASAQADRWPALLTAGKRGASALAGASAWHNYRQWSGRLARAEADGEFPADPWRALVPQYRGSRDYSRPGTPEFWTFLARIYEHPNQMALRHAYDLLLSAVRAAADRPEADPRLKGLQIPSFGAVRNYYERHADARAVALARRGEDWARNNLCDYVLRDAPAPDECWFSDHHLFDAAVREFDDARQTWRPVRPWLTAWMDWGSLWFAGYQVRTISPNRDAIERALRHGIERNDGHAPLHVYVDNGKDYRSHGFAEPILTASDLPGLQSVAEQLGARPHFAAPYNARAKVIESRFRIVCQQFSKYWDSYRGSTPADRPAQADWAWAHPESLPLACEFEDRFAWWLETVYHAAPSRGRILGGKSPAEVRRHALHPGRKLSAADLHRAFLREHPQPRKVQRGGVVLVNRRLYRSESLWQTLGRRDAWVRVKTDPDNVDVIYLYTLEGREIGPAQAKPSIPALVGSDPQAIEALHEEIRLQRRQLKAAKAASAAQRGLTHWLNRPSSPILAAALLPASSPPPAPRSASAASRSCPEISDDPDLVADLDAALRAETQARLDAREIPVDDADAQLLAELEAESLLSVSSVPSVAAAPAEEKE